MKQFVKRLSIFLFITLMISSILSAACLWQLRQSAFYKPSFLVNAVEEDTFDYIILGASTGLTTLDTKTIDSTLHTVGINLAIDDTSIPSHYLMLQHFLAQGKKTQYCILAPNNFNFASGDGKFSNNDYRFLMFVNKPYVQDYYSSFSQKQSHILKWSKWLPVLGVSYYNTEIFYPAILSVSYPHKRHRFDNKGNYSYPQAKLNNSFSKPKKSIALDFNSNYLEKIKTLCEQHNITLLCYLSPMASTSILVNKDTYKIINHSNLLSETKFFYDEVHTNSLGRKQASLAFARVFKQLEQQEER